MDVIRPAAEAKGVRLVTQLSQVPPVSGDADRLSQVIWNLLSNAVKFTEAGGTVTVKLQPQGGQVVLSVADTGWHRRAVPAARFRALHAERLVRVTPPWRPRPRLALVRELVELHGGTVKVSSGGVSRDDVYRHSAGAAQGMVSVTPRRS